MNIEHRCLVRHTVEYLRTVIYNVGRSSRSPITQYFAEPVSAIGMGGPAIFVSGYPSHQYILVEPSGSLNMVVVQFGVAVGNLTEVESEELIDEIVEEGLIEIGQQEWEIDELSYDGSRYSVDYMNSAQGDRSHYVFHAASEQTHDEGWLIIRFNWYDSNARTRDRVSYKTRFDEFIENLRTLSSLGNQVKKFTDKEVAVGAIEER